MLSALSSRYINVQGWLSIETFLTNSEIVIITLLTIYCIPLVSIIPYVRFIGKETLFDNLSVLSYHNNKIGLYPYILDISHILFYMLRICYANSALNNR